MTRELMDNGLWAASATLVLAQHRFEENLKTQTEQPTLYEIEVGGRPRHNVADGALELYRELDAVIDKDDIFFYVYGILHSPDYREAFAADLRKSLPRIPQVETAEDFWAFSRAGRELSHLHTEYEEVEPWPDLDIQTAEALDHSHEELYWVDKMRYAKITNAEGRKVEDKTTVIYNDHITISDIPERVHDYQLGARSALDWVLESNRVRTDKTSGITNDPNAWGIEHGRPAYIFDLLGQVVTVSMRTLDIIDELPSLEL